MLNKFFIADDPISRMGHKTAWLSRWLLDMKIEKNIFNKKIMQKSTLDNLTCHVTFKICPSNCIIHFLRSWH